MYSLKSVLIFSTKNGFASKAKTISALSKNNLNFDLCWHQYQKSLSLTNYLPQKSHKKIIYHKY